jgi:hypothetical protein
VAFITNQGLFEPTVMFFGLTNSPATFQTMMNAIFAEEIVKGWLIVYMDDLLIATKDDPKYHKQCVHKVLEKLKEHDLYLKPEKCIFEQRKIEFLGIVLEDGMVQMDCHGAASHRAREPRGRQANRGERMYRASGQG